MCFSKKYRCKLYFKRENLKNRLNLEKIAISMNLINAKLL